MSRFVPAVVASAAFLLLATAGCNGGGGDPLGTSQDALTSGPTLATAASFAVLANQAVTCTDGSIAGDVGTDQALPTGSITQTNCPSSGAIAVGTQASTQAYADFVTAYDATATQRCDRFLTGTLANVRLTPGIYCFQSAAALTGTLTLDGPSTGTWLFKIGTSGSGALTATHFSVVMANGGSACNVTWWIAGAATLTDSNFVGTILAGEADTVTRGTFEGRTFSMADVTLTGTALLGCTGGSIPGSGPSKSHCNQGVGNGAEGCDPGHSDDHHHSNDENGGTPGHPGRKP